MNTQTAAKALGWLSIGLGVTELVAPGWLQKKVGLQGHERLMRVFGVRELLSGAGILGGAAKAGLWSRVAGDAIDMAALAAAAKKRTEEGGVGTALAMVAALTVLDALEANRQSAASEDGSPPARKTRERLARH